MYVLLISFFLVALVFSFFCSLWEAVLLSITPSHARIQSKEGTRVGRYLEDFKANIDRPLAAILTLNTIAHTVGAIGVGAQAAVIWADAYPWITRFAVPALMTIGILVFSEIVPKTIGAMYWQRLMTFTAHALRLLTLALIPFVWLSQYLTKGIKGDSSQAVLTRTDFLTMAELGAEEGVFEEEESQMIGNMLSGKSVHVKDVMTPRTVVAATSENNQISDYYDVAKTLSFNRIPIYDESTDHVTGYVLKTDLFVAQIDGKGSELISTLRREIIAVNETFTVSELFSEFRKRREQFAVVLDEFGGMAGIVTLEDVIETLLGLEIVDETDTDVDMRELAQRHREEREGALEVLEGSENNNNNESSEGVADVGGTSEPSSVGDPTPITSPAAKNATSNG